jgi:hypothetical protein
MDQESNTRKVASLVKQLGEAEENLRLVDERIAQYVQEVDVPLQLIRSAPLQK